MNTTSTTPAARTLTASQRAAVRRTLEASYRFHPLARRTCVAWVVLAGKGRAESVPERASVTAYYDRPVVAVVTESLPKFWATEPGSRFTIEGFVQPEGCSTVLWSRRYAATLDEAVALFRADIKASHAKELEISADPEKLLARALRSVDWTGWASDDGRAYRAMVAGIDAAKSIAAKMDPDTARRVWEASVPTDGRGIDYVAFPRDLAPARA